MTDTKNIDKDIFNFLRRRGSSKLQVLGKDDYNITIYVLSFDIKGEKYAFNNFMSKKELTYKIINMLEENEAISLGEDNPNIFDENRQKVVQTVRFYLDNYFNLNKKNPISESTKKSLTDNNHKQLKEETTKKLIESVLNLLVLPQYEHVICGFELHNLDEKSLGNAINHPEVDVTFIGGKGTKLYPQTRGIQKMYDDVLNEIWDVVYNYTGISLQLYSKYVKDCGKENIYLKK